MTDPAERPVRNVTVLIGGDEMARIDEAAQDVLLHTVIDRDDVVLGLSGLADRPRPTPLGEGVRLLRSDELDEIEERLPNRRIARDWFRERARCG